MNIKKNLLQIGALALGLSLAACGGNQPSSGGALSQGDAQQLSENSKTELALTGSMLSDAGTSSASVQAVGAQAELYANALGFGLPRRIVHVLAALEAHIPDASNPNCTISKDPAAPVDADSDGTPATVKITFNCAGTTAGGTAFSTEGEASLQDTDDAAANSGFSLSLTNFHAKATRTDGSLIDRTISGSFSRNKTGSDWQISKQYSHNVSVTKGSTTNTGSVSLEVNKTYTPDDAARPFAAGTVKLDKATPGSMTWTRNAKTRSLSWYTDPTVHWNRALCQAPARVLNFDSGAKEFVHTNPDGKKSTLRLEFSGCGNITTKLTQDGGETTVE
jgi:hypothetical protein